MSKEELKILQLYCFKNLQEDVDYKIDNQSFSPAWYQDILMNTFLYQKKSLVEKETNLELYPTYAYWRYYIFGASLKKHTDRHACEISITTCIKKYDKWSLTIEKDNFELEEGDALLYAGHDQKHGRPGIYKGEGMAQLFLHYVNKNGIYSHHANDYFG